MRRHLQQKFTRIFVDEFQDTDPIQAEILLLLADGVPGKLFIVGDPKQAIYRFRGADVETYWRVRDQIASGGGRVLRLRTSYRSVPAIQRFVNAAFAPLMTGDRYSLQAEYVPLAEQRPADDSKPAIVALPVPEPYWRRGAMKASPRAIEASLPDAVGAFIAWLVDEKTGWDIKPSDIAVLFRRFVSFGEDMTRPYVDALEARGISHLLVGGKAFHGREEVETIRAALAAIEWPDDELSVFAALKGSLFAIDDEPLLEFRHRFGTFHPFRVPKELGGNSGQDLVLTGEPTAHLMPIADALRALEQLHRGRNYRPVADTIGRLLTETRAHVGFILRPAGEQALANVLHVAELARQYEASGGISFRGFIDELRDAASEDAAEAPILEEGSDGVRLMTVHKAKGLEFKAVILADLTCRMSRADASRYLDASSGLCATKIGGWAPHELHQHEQKEVACDEAEGVRLAYVAATRAKDLLVVPAPPMASRRDGKRGPKCPAFKSKDSVLRRPNDEAAGPGTVAPGLHPFADAGYSVVWWDPSALELGLKPTFGVRREDLIVKDVPRNVVGDGRSKYDHWQLARARAREAGAIPSLAVATAREVSEKEEGRRQKESEKTDFRLETLDLRTPFHPERTGGAEFGTLVHAILARVPFDAARMAIDDAASVEARVFGMTDADAIAAADVAAKVLKHDLLKRAHAAEARGACRRETPVTCTLDDGTLVEGVVDLAFEDTGRWIVVDYKTDREIAEDGEDRYREQISLYATAIARATGLPAECVLVRV